MSSEIWANPSAPELDDQFDSVSLPNPRNATIQLLQGQAAFLSGFLEMNEMMTEYLKLRSNRDFYKEHPKPEKPRNIFMIQGFMAPSYSLNEASSYLQRIGHNTEYAFLEPNLISLRQFNLVENAVLTKAKKTEDSVVIVGQSAGGTLGILAAQKLHEEYENGKHPDLKKPPVSDVFTLGSPIGQSDIDDRDVPQTAVFVRSFPEMVMRQDPNSEGLLKMTKYFYQDIPKEINVTSYISHRDRIVHPAFSVRDGVDIKYVNSAHTGMGLDFNILNDIREKLAS